jgi:hypothetical protein
MSAYINTITKEYPLYPGDMELLFSNFNENNIPEGYAIVFQPDIPEITDTQIIEEIQPVLIDGVWTKQFIVLDLTEDQLNNRKALRSRGVPDLTQSGSAPNVID